MGDGFEKFYGFLGGETNQWEPTLLNGTSPVRPPKHPDKRYHLSEDLVDQTIGWVQAQTSLTPDKPFFAYLSFGAVHAPHHVAPPWRQPYHGRFDQGWDLQRDSTLARQRSSASCRRRPSSPLAARRPALGAALGAAKAGGRGPDGELRGLRRPHRPPGEPAPGRPDRDGRAR
ncbi:sulfatase-like hydrolase/transferase [Streptosporangium lutulentum]